MFALMLKTIQYRVVSVLIYILICAGFLWLMVAMFPTMQKEGEQLVEAFKNYPEGFLKAFDADIENIFVSIEGFLATEYYSIVWPIILIILVLNFGSSAIAGEIDRGTIDVLLAQPVSRTKVYLAKLFSGILIILTFVFASNFSVIPFAHLHNVDYQLQSYLTISVSGSLFAFAIFGLCMMFSSLFSTRGKASSMMGFILITMYALDLVAKFRESWESVKYVSFFYYFDGAASLIDKHIDPLAIGVFLGIGIMGAMLGLLIFTKRDIAT